MQETATSYLVSTKREPPLLLRSVRDERGLREEAFRDGRWEPTSIVRDYMAGRNDFVEEIGEHEARALEPSAF